LAREVDGTPFRLIGVGAAPLADLADADQPDLADPGGMRDVKAQLAVDALRARFGADAIGRGRGFKSPGE
jgi:DNA polymerase-4